MDFESTDTKISIEQDYYCLLPQDTRNPAPTSGTEIMKIYWNYSCPDGWGSISEEYVSVNDVHTLNKKLKELEHGVCDEMSMDLFGLYPDCPFISLHLVKQDATYHVNLKVFDGNFDVFIPVSCSISETDWKPYSEEFRKWAKKYSLRLGDKVETLIHYDNRTFSLGRIGEVTEIHPATDKSPACIAVSFTDIDSTNKPYQSTRLYNFDEVRRITEA